MMLLDDSNRPHRPIGQDLQRIRILVFEAFAETMKGKLSTQHKEGRILKLLLQAPHRRTDHEISEPRGAYYLLAVVNYPRLASRREDWRLVQDRLRCAWEHGEISRPVRLSVESLERINSALAEGIPHFVAIATSGIVLYEMDGPKLLRPRNLPPAERQAKSEAEFARWHGRACDFLIGAAFFDERDNRPMAALMLHQACEHLYQSVSWSLTLHGLRTHALDQLREVGEGLDNRLRAAWPRSTRFERHAFGCIRRAYVEVRYGQHFQISRAELDWSMECAAALNRITSEVCRAKLDAMASMQAGERNVQLA